MIPRNLFTCNFTNRSWQFGALASTVGSKLSVSELRFYPVGRECPKVTYKRIETKV